MTIIKARGKTYSLAFEELNKIMYVWQAQKVFKWEVLKGAKEVELTVTIQG